MSINRSYSIHLLFRHPRLDLAGISQMLGVQPDHMAMHGDPITRPGAPPGAHQFSHWSLVTECVAESEHPLADVKEMIQWLTGRWQPIRALQDSGVECHLTLYLQDRNYFSDALSATLLRQLADMGINLGIGVGKEAPNE